MQKKIIALAVAAALTAPAMAFAEATVYGKINMS
jgi:predicted porin